MSAENSPLTVPPEGLRPAEIGVVALGRVILGHSAVTLADLAERGLLQVAELPGGADGDWELRRTRPRPGEQAGLLPFEEKLLEPLLRDGDRARLSGLTGQLTPAVQGFRQSLLREMVRRGWLQHLHHDQRTPEGDRLAGQIRSFRAGLRHLKASAGEGALTSQLRPYALLFGLLPGDQAADARFAGSWVHSCSCLPGLQPPPPKRPDFDEVEFTHDEWRGMSLDLAAAWASGL